MGQEVEWNVEYNRHDHVRISQMVRLRSQTDTTPIPSPIRPLDPTSPHRRRRRRCRIGSRVRGRIHRSVPFRLFRWCWHGAAVLASPCYVLWATVSLPMAERSSTPLPLAQRHQPSWVSIDWTSMASKTVSCDPMFPALVSIVWSYQQDWK